MLHIVRKLFNSIPSTRIIYRQESVMEIAKLPFTTCSEQIIPVHAIGYYRITEKPVSNNMMSLYGHRNINPKQNFADFFYRTYESKPTAKPPIMHISGLNGNPVYPVSYDYARSVLIFYKPWSGINKDLLKDRSQVITEFNEFVNSSDCPISVKQAYTRAKLRYKNGQEFIDNNKEDEEYFLHNNNLSNDVELSRFIEFSNSFPREAKDFSIMNGYQLNIGRNYNWSKDPIDSTGKDWLYKKIQLYETSKESTLLDDGNEIVESNTSLDIPTLHNGMDYSVNNLLGRQKSILSAIFDNLTQWVNYTNGKVATYSPLRMTVLGQGGTGKSFVINTIVSEIRKHFKRNDSVIVTAPTGASAFNVGGQTMHREFGVTKTKSNEMSELMKKRITKNLKHVVCLIIDERSMVSSTLLSKAENNIRQTAYCGHNSKLDWAGIPIVIVLGDDYQLPPVGNGIINGFWDLNMKDVEKKKRCSECELKGHKLFLDLTDNVIELIQSHRVDENENMFQEILNSIRKGNCSKKFAKMMMQLHKTNFNNDEWKEIEKDATFVFANRDKMEEHNSKMLSQTSNAENPVANIAAKLTRIGDSNKKPTWSHFDANDVVKFTSLCVNARVAIKGRNFYPKWGLHNGATGTVKKIAYVEGKNPNNGDLPEYVEVEFPKLDLPKAVANDCKHKVSNLIISLKLLHAILIYT